MKKFVVLSLLFVFLISACGNEESVDHSTDEISVETEFLGELPDETKNEDDTYIDINLSPETVYKTSFCLIPNKLAEYVGDDEYINWADNTSAYQNNLYEFIQYFDITRSELEKIYYSTNMYYLYDYNFDVLYGGDEEQVYEYYKLSTPDSSDFLKRNTEWSIKSDIKKYVGKDVFSEWLTTEKAVKTTVYNDTCWSIAEAVYEFDIPRADLEEIIKNIVGPDAMEVIVTEEYADGSEAVVSGNGVMAFEYDLDAIYEFNNISQMIRSGNVGYLADEAIRK